MKTNWYSVFPVIQIQRISKKRKIVEPVEKSPCSNDNYKKEDNYYSRRKENEEE
jgi:hypothetical protein